MTGDAADDGGTDGSGGGAQLAVLAVTPPARELVLAARSAEADAEHLALFLEVSGTAGGAYAYDMWFESAADVGPADAVEHVGDLVVVVPAGSVDKLRGATLDVGDNGGGDGLVIVNPNSPPADRLASAPPVGDLSSPLAQRVLAVLDDVVNPQIAGHGGFADLVAVEGGTVYLRMGGGCQGCGLAQVTLSQGITVAIKEAVPEVLDVVDVTAHADGTNPYYEAAKK